MGKDQALRGKLAIVTGASKLSGIGAATAVALAEQGANVGAHFLAFHCYRALWPLFFNQCGFTFYCLFTRQVLP